MRSFPFKSIAERRFSAGRLSRFFAHARLERELAKAWRDHPSAERSRARVDRELAPFAGRELGTAAIEQQWRLLLEWDAPHALRLRWDGSRLRCEGPRAAHERALWLAWAVELVARSARFPALDLLANFGDRLDRDMAHAPVLSSCRREGTTGQLLVPDFEFLRGRGALEREVDAAIARYPWDEKAKVAFWRGVTTGEGFATAEFRVAPRMRLVLASLAAPDLVDARFTALKQGAENNPELQDPRYRAAVVSPAESLRFRYLVDVDGNSSSWSRLVWLLRSNSAVLKQRSPFLQWYYPWLVPGRHFLPLAPDFTDLPDVVRSLRDRDADARAIADAGRAFALEHLSPLAGFVHLAQAIDRVVALRASPHAPAPEPQDRDSGSVAGGLSRRLGEKLDSIELEEA